MFLVLSVANGCLHPGKPDSAHLGRVGLYLLARPGDSRNPADLMQLFAANGKTVVVLRQPLLTSADFTAAESFSSPYGNCLKFTLAPQSRYQWMQLSRELAGRTIAVNVDGWMHVQLPLPPPEPSETESDLILCGDWRQDVGDIIVRHTAENYQQLKHKIP